MSRFSLETKLKQLSRVMQRYLHIAFLMILLLMLLLAIDNVFLEDNKSKSSANSLPKYLPSCIIIGVRKGGTRALLDMLTLHSAIRVANHEVHFFDVDENYLKGYSWYREHMPPLEKGVDPRDIVVMEKTPNYFVSPSVPQRIHRMNESTHLLLVVRDPVTRLISDYTQILHNRLEKGLPFKSFEDAALHPNGSINTHYDAVVKSIYASYLNNWFQFFPRNQIHVVNGDKLIRKPWRELQKVETFLGLNKEIEQDMFFFNATKGFHCIQKKGKERCLTNAKGRPHPKVSKEVTTLLRKFYAPFNYKFYDMVGKDFGWPEE